MPKSFSRDLLKWYQTNQRDLPWKEGKDPYKIWISEIILQQTRLAQGIPYYLRFIDTFPNIKKLARAKEDQVLKLWEGLGYYSRARNLHFTAKYISNELNGVFPQSYEEIIKLKGIGPYTAAAISSFAFGLKFPVVDGNVLRLISRYFGIEESIDISNTHKTIKALCSEAIENTDPAIFNQAIMDFGARICTPKRAKCINCPLNETCFAFAKDRVYDLPIRTKKVKKKKRYLAYYLVENQGKILISKRTKKDIWQGLYEFPLIEFETEKDFDKAEEQELAHIIFKEKNVQVSESYKHILTHQTIKVKFIHRKGYQKNKEYSETEVRNLENYAFPRVIQKYLQSRQF